MEQGAWVAQLVKCLPLVMILGSWDGASHQASCSAGSASPAPLLVLSLTPSQKKYVSFFFVRKKKRSCHNPLQYRYFSLNSHEICAKYLPQLDSWLTEQLQKNAPLWEISVAAQGHSLGPVAAQSLASAPIQMK